MNTQTLPPPTQTEIQTYLEDALLQLLDTPDLNLDELDPITEEAIHQAMRALRCSGRYQEPTEPGESEIAKLRKTNAELVEACRTTLNWLIERYTGGPVRQTLIDAIKKAETNQ